MTNLTQAILAVFLLSFCSIVFAETSTSVSSTVTTTPINNTNNTDKTSLSTTFTTTTTSPTNPKDDDIVSAVYAKYAKDPALIGTTLTVSSQNGIVTVSGTVTAQSQADEASIAAKSIAGVKDVRSTINVTTNPNLNHPAKTSNY